MMDSSIDIQLSNIIPDYSAENILKEVKTIFLYHYSEDDFVQVENCFDRVLDVFAGDFPGYRACNTEYHDLEHTMDAFLACGRLLDGFNLKKKKMDSRMAVMLLMAALFHDIGYIQEEDDTEGTGAKYTDIHVERGIEFINRHYADFSIKGDYISSMSRFLWCTGLNENIDRIPFASSMEKAAGILMGTADIVGQMSSRIYPEKLLYLFDEFKETQIDGFETEFDILKKTRGFYTCIKRRLYFELKKAYSLAVYHFQERYSIDRNLYIEAIEKHMTFLGEIMEDPSSNFRKKLKRTVNGLE